MTCRCARRQMADLFDGGDPELQEHLADCGSCAAEFEEMLNAVARVEPLQRVCASPDFKERTMSKLNAAQPEARSIPYLRLAFAAGILLIVFLALPGRGPVSLLAQSAQALNGVKSVHILARMRTPPRDNFESIGAEYDFQPVEMWKEFGPAPRWRVENPGRVVVMDGTQSTLFIRPGSAVHGGPHAGFLEWLRPLLDPEKVLAAEISAAQRRESHDVSLRQEGPRITLTASRMAAGEFVNGWGKNTSIAQSDNTRVYRFDAATSRLTGLQVLVQGVSVFEILEIRYNESIAPELFTLTLPDDVVWDLPPERMPMNQPLPVTARDAAVAFLEGLGDRDWDRALTVFPAAAIPEQYKDGGFRVISIGEPFQSGVYAGWYVPYEIEFRNGYHKKWKLALRNDNSAHRWLFDGGY